VITANLRVLVHSQSTCTVPQVGTGVCQDISTPCSGSYYSGYCAGPNNIKCCVSGSGGNGWGSYEPPASVQKFLGNLLNNTSPQKTSWGYIGAKATFLFPKYNNIIYYDSKMDADCDGAPSCPSIDPYGQKQTSWTWKGQYIDALNCNYFVLPSNLKSKIPNYNIKLGDVAAILYNGTLTFAVYADSGPTTKIGEGSIKLLQTVGFNPYCSSGKVCYGISSGVVTIVFPGTSGTYSSPYDLNSVATVGRQKLNGLINGNPI